MKPLLLHKIKITAYCCITFIAQTQCMENPLQTVIRNKGISEGERTALKNRLPIVKAALEELLKRPLDNKCIPKISLITSGGGYRAKFCTLGSLCGAKKIGLLDTVTYITALSGSTWAVAPWICIGMPLREFKPYIQACAAKSFFDLTLHEKTLILETLEKKIANKQPLTLVDPYGSLLGNRLLEKLGDERHNVTLSQLAQKVETGAYPYPIFTAIDARPIVTGQTWYEFTPHTVGDHTNNTQISTSAYGKKFKKGIAVNDAPEKSLDYCMGTWGSAFGANVYEIVKEIIQNDELFKEISKLIPDTIAEDRLLPFYAIVANYMRGMDDIADTTLSAEKYMEFVDSGLEINLPYPPVSGICPERTSDILIFLDASADQIGNELKNVVDYAQKHNLPFPTINFNEIDKKTISIFEDTNNTAAPLVIYMPRISDPLLWEKYKNDPDCTRYNLSGFDLDYETNHGFCKTQEFQYSLEHSTLVTNQTEFNMRVNENIIKKAINAWIDRK